MIDIQKENLLKELEKIVCTERIRIMKYHYIRIKLIDRFLKSLAVSSGDRLRRDLREASAADYIDTVDIIP